MDPLGEDHQDELRRLFVAAKGRSLGHLEEVVRSMPTQALINAQDANGFTPLNAACWNKRVKNVNYLLSVPGIDVNKPANLGETPLMTAVSSECRKIIELLVSDPRTDVNRVSVRGRSALYWATERGNLVACKELLKNPLVDCMQRRQAGDETPFDRAIRDDNSPLVKLMVAMRGAHLFDEINEASKASSTKAISEFRENPLRASFEWMHELGLAKPFASWLYCNAVMISDEYLRIAPPNTPPGTKPDKEANMMSRAARFFGIIRGLPDDLIRVVSLRSQGLGGVLLPSSTIEGAFASLFRDYLLRSKNTGRRKSSRIKKRIAEEAKRKKKFVKTK